MFAFDFWLMHICQLLFFLYFLYAGQTLENKFVLFGLKILKNAKQWFPFFILDDLGS